MPPRPRRLALPIILFLLASPTTAFSDQNAQPDPPDLPAIALRLANDAARPLRAWYDATPAIERVAWGGLAACTALAGLTLIERLLRTRPGRILPRSFRDRLLNRLLDGRLDWHQAIDHCEMNPSPATHITLAALRRAGRPGSEIERGVSLALNAESATLRRHLPTLRRVAALAPLIGLLGTLGMIQRALQILPPDAAWGPTLAHALLPLISADGLAILALVSYDGLSARVDGLIADLERIGAEVVDHLAAAPRHASRPGSHPAHTTPAPHPGHAGPRPPREA